MPNEPIPAKKKRTPPEHRQNAQGDHEGSPHRPEEFLRGQPLPPGPQSPGPQSPGPQSPEPQTPAKSDDPA